MIRKLASTAAVALIVALPAPALAQVDGPCVVSLNGVELERVDSLNSPLELETDDTLVAAGTDPATTRSAVVRLLVGPVALESGTTTYATPSEEFEATITLDDVAPYGVGLFRAEITTDGCSAGAWVRVSGRFPLATLTGLTAIGLTIGGITGQLGAVTSRRRWARSAASLGGVATGVGATLLGQQFGRLQLSYVSLALITLIAAFGGWLLASAFNPAVRETRRADRATRPSPKPSPEASPAQTEVNQPEPEPEPATAKETVPNVASDAATSAAPASTETRTENKEPSPATTPAAAPVTAMEPQATVQPEPTQLDGPYWCYVLAPTDVFDLTDHTRRIASLTPGSWYLAKRTVSGWAHVVAGEGSEGWVAASAIHRQG